jgi:hypothetical protein
MREFQRIAGRIRMRATKPDMPGIGNRSVLHSLMTLLCIAAVVLCGCDGDGGTSSGGSGSATMGDRIPLRQRSYAEAWTFTDISNPDHNSVTRDSVVEETAFSDTLFTFEDRALEIWSPDHLARADLQADVMHESRITVDSDQTMSNIFAYVRSAAEAGLIGLPSGDKVARAGAKDVYVMDFELDGQGARKLHMSATVEQLGDSTKCAVTVSQFDSQGNWVGYLIRETYFGPVSGYTIIPFTRDVALGPGRYKLEVFSSAKEYRDTGSTGSAAGAVASTEVSIGFFKHP